MAEKKKGTGRFIVIAEEGVVIGRKKVAKGEVLPSVPVKGGILKAAIHFKQVREATPAELKTAAAQAPAAEEAEAEGNDPPIPGKE